MTSIAGLINFLVYFSASIVLLAAFLALYTVIVPLHEWKLIREGNTAVATVMAAAMIGFSLPLASAIVNSAGLADMVMSSLLQLLCFAAMRLLRRDASRALADGDMAEAILLSGASVASGILNAACLS